MKWNKYNLLFHSPKYGYFLYNSILNIFFKLDELQFNEIKKLKESPNNIDSNNTFHSELLKYNIFCKDDNLILDNFHFQYLLKKFDKNYLSYTIIPTLDCNFRCSYCFEENNERSYMTEDIISKVIQFIVDTTKNTRYFYLTWYGGEPLLHKKAIYKITNEIKKLNINLKSSLITNGYLINDFFINSIKELNIYSIQITLDGLMEEHNKRRPHVKNHNSFQKIIQNLDLLKNRYNENEIDISIRVNIDNKNSKNFFDVFTFLKKRYGNFINVYPGIVKDWNLNIENSCFFNKNDEINFILENYEKYQIKTLSFYPKIKIPCTAQRVYDYVIGPKGELYKCWSDVGKPDFIVGNICEKSTNYDLLTKYLVSIEAFNDPVCKECFFLPICGGGCPNQRLKNKFMGASFETCTYFKGNLERFLEIHFNSKNTNQLVKKFNSYEIRK